MNNKEIFVVTAYRWGEYDNHSYVVGVFDEQQKVIDCANKHTIYRGGKYGCAIDKCLLNFPDIEEDNYTEEIYKSKSLKKMNPYIYVLAIDWWNSLTYKEQVYYGIESNTKEIYKLFTNLLGNKVDLY